MRHPILWTSRTSNARSVLASFRIGISKGASSVLHAVPILVQVHAELHLPRVADKESCALMVSDADGLMWELKYRSVVLCRLLLRRPIIALFSPFWNGKLSKGIATRSEQAD
jgi:hypothetical protein